jgi:type II secretory pathway pseudopilin PulG
MLKLKRMKQLDTHGQARGTCVIASQQEGIHPRVNAWFSAPLGFLRKNSQKGIGLVETLVAVAILGTAIVTFISALSTGAISVGNNEQETIAQRLAQSQIESTQSAAFALSGVYPTIATPAGYSLTVQTGSVPGTDVNIQKITVTVLRNSISVFVVSGYKVNR